MNMSYRLEKDFLGEEQIPVEAYWGIHTKRARSNFLLSTLKMPKSFIHAFAKVKKAACLANKELGYLKEDKAKMIEAACDDVINAKLDNQFFLDALQGGAGTSTNMNLNEVIANRALELSGEEKGRYDLIHPLEDVNLHQSTNDTYPTAVKITAIYSLRRLSAVITDIQQVCQNKEKEFRHILKVGRTELQEAVPITLGAEFSSFADAFSRDRWRTFKSEERLRMVNIGGTAVGTGITAPRSYIFLVIEKLRDLTGLGLCRGENIIDITANGDCFVEVSGIIKAHASNFVKIANDLRLMNLLGEIVLPQMQTGSSIMPGKVNPVILESVIQAGLKVMANDILVSESVSRSSFQIPEFMPLLAFALIESIEILINTNIMFAKHIAKIKVDKKQCEFYFDKSPAIATAFIPYIGYDKTAELLRKSKVLGKNNLREFFVEELGCELVDRVLLAHNLVSLGYGENNHEKNT